LSYAYRPVIDFWLKNHSFKNTVLMVDSGAFTNWQLGKKIDINDYVNYLKNDVAPTVQNYSAIQLDVIGEPVQTRKNLDKMCNENLNILPVFTKGEKYSELKELYKYNDYICCGGLVGSQADTYINHLMKISPQSKLHLLGYGKQRQLKLLKPYSADVTNILDFFKFGKFSLWNKSKCLLFIIDPLEFFNLTCDNSLVTDIKKYKKSCFTRCRFGEHKGQHESTALLVVIQQYLLQAVYFYYVHNVRLYFSISSHGIIFSRYMEIVMQSKEVQDYIKELKIMKGII